MQTSIEFKAETRQGSGKGQARATRNVGMIPATIYGLGQAHIIAIPFKDFTKEYLKGGLMSKLATINLDGQKINVITRDVQLHPVTDNPLHIDFQQIEESKPVKVVVRLKVINEQKCASIKRGGVLNIVLRQIKVYCLPNQIQHAIEIDITEMRIGQSIHINDISLPIGMSSVNKSNFVILSIGGGIEDTNEETQTA